MRKRLSFSAGTLGLMLAAAASAHAQTDPLVVAAKREGSVTWYTALIVDQVVRPMSEAFEQKYGITVNFVRSGDSDLSLRIFNEAKAGRTQADIFDAVGAVPALKEQGLTAKGLPDDADHLPAVYRDPAAQWVATHLSVLTPGINTNLVPSGSEPRTLQDLLDPKWKGKIAWNSDPSTAGGPGFVGLVLRVLGQDKGMAYLRQLATQQIVSLKVSAREVLDQVIAGEYAIGLQTYNYHSLISAKQGAPVKWVAMNPSMAVLAPAAQTRDAPHPNAAKLLIGFQVSPEGQRIFRDAGYIPVDPDIPPNDPSLRPDGVKFRAEFFTPDEVHASLANWTKLYQQLFQ